MVKIYISLILKGEKTINDVPSKIREDVRANLIEMGRDDLAQ